MIQFSLAISLSPTGHSEVDRKNCFINRDLSSASAFFREFCLHQWSPTNTM
jgi:hypothetical protein